MYAPHRLAVALVLMLLLANAHAQNTIQEEKPPVAAGESSVKTGSQDRASGMGTRPQRTYKNVTLVGSGYEDINDEEFFSMLSKAIDIVGEMPQPARADAELVGEVVYDPPSKTKLGKDKADPRTVSADSFFVDSKRAKPGIVRIVTNLRFRSALDVAVYNLHKNGRATRLSIEAKALEKELAAGSLSAPKVAAKRERLALLRGGVVEKQSNPNAFNKLLCEQLTEEFQILKVLDAPPNMQNEVGKLLWNRGCS